MKLFVSDLDGTLLNSNKEISCYSKEILNKFIGEGGNFTIATARTPATANIILNDINLNLPVILMNGAIIYDIKNKDYINVIDININIIDSILNILETSQLSPIIYSIYNNHLFVYHKEFKNQAEKNFYDERYLSPDKTFIKTNDYKSSISNKKVVNFLMFDELKKIKIAYDKLKKIPGITLYLYKDIYVNEDLYNLEIYSNQSSKSSGIKYLKDRFNFEEIICFGDNLNDICMFKSSDKCYAVKNSCPELKSLATKIISSNNDDAVAKQIISSLTSA